MAVSYESSKINWNYYLSIEKDFENVSQFVEFTEFNEKTFSIIFARLLMTSTQEIDVLLKKICNLVDKRRKPNNITEYQEIIDRKIPEFKNETVYMNRFGMKSNPWHEWNSPKTAPSWWKANNKIKHERTSYFGDANLKNCFQSIGALLITNIYYEQKKLELEENKKIDFKIITEKLTPTSTLLKLDSKYYLTPIKVIRAL